MVASGLLLLARLAASIVAASAAYCHEAPSPDARPNLYPTRTESPRTVRAVRNGLLEWDGVIHGDANPMRGISERREERGGRPGSGACGLSLGG